MAVKKKSKKIAARKEEVPPPPTFEDLPCPEPCEEVACGPYEQDCPAPCVEEPYPEPFEHEDDFDASERGPTPVQGRSTQPLHADVIEDEQEIKQEPTLSLAETSQEVSEQAWISPYTQTPVQMQFGAEETAYLVPPHFLPSKWLESDAQERFKFPDIDAYTGHTIVHYLYKGLYEAPPTSNLAAVHNHNGLGAALLVFIATSSHGLHDLQQLAIQEIEKHGSSLSLTELLETIDDQFSRLDHHSWVHEYLRRRAKEGFDQDHAVFSDKAFLQNLKSAALIKFMAKCVVDLFSAKMDRMISAGQALSRPESPEDRDKQHASAIEDSLNMARTTSRSSSGASEISVEQSCEPRAKSATLSDSFSTLSCSIPEPLPCEIDPYPEPVAEDDLNILEQSADSAPPEMCEAVDEPWPDSEQPMEPEPEVIQDSPGLVEEAADESVTKTRRWSAICSGAQNEDIPVAVDVEEQAYLPPCHSQIQHVLLGTGWKRCAHCLNVVRRLAGQVS